MAPARRRHHHWRGLRRLQRQRVARHDLDRAERRWSLRGDGGRRRPRRGRGDRVGLRRRRCAAGHRGVGRGGRLQPGGGRHRPVSHRVHRVAGRLPALRARTRRHRQRHDGAVRARRQLQQRQSRHHRSGQLLPEQPDDLHELLRVRRQRRRRQQRHAGAGRLPLRRRGQHRHSRRLFPAEHPRSHVAGQRPRLRFRPGLPPDDEPHLRGGVHEEARRLRARRSGSDLHRRSGYPAGWCAVALREPRHVVRRRHHRRRRARRQRRRLRPRRRQRHVGRGGQDVAWRARGLARRAVPVRVQSRRPSGVPAARHRRADRG